LKVALIVLFLAAAAYPQTKDLGMGSFANESGPIMMAVDAQLVVQSIDRPYAMFVLFMGAREKEASITVAAKDVVMVYKGQEYHMPKLAELRENYRGEMRDLGFYRRLGQEGILSSWVRFYDFPNEGNFFPPLTAQSGIAATEANLVALNGFITPIYFKNPGFAKGDKLTIKVKDVKNPNLTGEIEVVLQ
ncbi:MAG TPA: hypothetical protein VKT17_10160, partial [Acidobacteriota bacterium]|nr:hypothetical protein [Acidobacteriota bacterium]